MGLRPEGFHGLMKETPDSLFSNYEKHQPASEFNVTFTEGAVFYKGLWRFYYGAQDHCIGLAEMKDIASLWAWAPKTTAP